VAKPNGLAEVLEVEGLTLAVVPCSGSSVFGHFDMPGLILLRFRDSGQVDWQYQTSQRVPALVLVPTQRYRVALAATDAST
jgi:hypothetical protein